MAKKDKLARLRAARAGVALSDSDNDDDMNQIYDEVDESTYREHKRDRVLNDDFIVDDNGDGYAETGADDWETPHQYYSDDEGQEQGVHKNQKNQPKVKMITIWTF